MEKLKLEHLTPYLPYGLQCHNMGNIEDDGNAFISEIVGLDQDSVWVSHEHEDGDYDYSDTLPILLPMSSLKNSDLMKCWNKEHSIEIRYNKRIILDVNSSTCIDIIGYPLTFITDLFKNHFDVFGLIEKGLAVDINTL